MYDGFSAVVGVYHQPLELEASSMQRRCVGNVW
jgi:hypothetical protein